MSDLNHWLKKNPAWVWWSFFPVLGGLAITYAGNKSNTSNWVWLGIGITGTALILSSTQLTLLIWILQIVIAFSLKKRFLVKTLPRGVSITDYETAQLMAEIHGKIDINNCSKDELVYRLGLPIVYANDIESVRNEGHIFTHLEELSELAGIPETHLKRIEPLIIFTYDINKEFDVSWRQLNRLSKTELIASGIDDIVAQKIINERNKNGLYSSLIDVKRRTGFPLSCYRHLL